MVRIITLCLCINTVVAYGGAKAGFELSPKYLKNERISSLGAIMAVCNFIENHGHVRRVAFWKNSVF